MIHRISPIMVSMRSRGVPAPPTERSIGEHWRVHADIAKPRLDALFATISAPRADVEGMASYRETGATPRKGRDRHRVRRRTVPAKSVVHDTTEKSPTEQPPVENPLAACDDPQRARDTKSAARGLETGGLEGGTRNAAEDE